MKVVHDYVSNIAWRVFYQVCTTETGIFIAAVTMFQ